MKEDNQGSSVSTKRRSHRDRRTGVDRRAAHDLRYAGPERRAGDERRINLTEKRSGWVRDTQWSSIFIENLR